MATKVNMQHKNPRIWRYGWIRGQMALLNEVFPSIFVDIPEFFLQFIDGHLSYILTSLWSQITLRTELDSFGRFQEYFLLDLVSIGLLPDSKDLKSLNSLFRFQFHLSIS